MAEVVVRYPAAVVVGDVLRAGAGLAATLCPLLLLSLHPWVAALMLLAAVLFGVFLAATIRRAVTQYRLDESGIVADGPFGGAVRWQNMERVGLRYYSTRRDRRDGWMELRLADQVGRVTVDSTLDAFDTIASRAAAAARRRGLVLTPVTIENFAALGIDARAPDQDGCDTPQRQA